MELASSGQALPNANEAQIGPEARVTSVVAATVRIPLEAETSFSTRRVVARDYGIVRIRTDDGHEGIGFCYGGSAGGESVALAIRQLLGQRLIGQDPFRVEGIWSELYQEALLHGRTGSIMRALSILDIALWDRNARSVGLPLHKYLGGFHRRTVPAYASGGYYLEGKTPAMLGAEMARYVQNGFRAVKMKVGRLDLTAEEERIRAAREAIGPDILLMLDANNAWSDVPTALRFMDRYEKYDPYWIEEPFSPDEIESHAELARRIRTPVATGEIEAGRWRHKELLDKRAAAILQTDAAVCGGITEYRRIAALASAYGVKMCPHWFHDLHVHLVASGSNGQFVEYFPDDQVLNFRRLVDRQLEVENGELVLSQRPGLGFDFVESNIERWSLDGWR